MFDKVRHECCVRQLLVYRHELGIAKFRLYIQKTNFSSEVWEDYYKQFKSGNKGEWGCWNNTLLEQQGLDI